jgi:hypothetical protein
MFRFGSRTSPAVKVMLFQASAEKSELVCATQMATNRPRPVAAVRPPPTPCSAPRGVHRLEKLALTASAFQPMRTPSTMSAISAPVLANVKTFCTSLPSWRPRVFIQVRSAIIAIATSWAVDSEMA